MVIVVVLTGTVVVVVGVLGEIVLVDVVPAGAVVTVGSLPGTRPELGRSAEEFVVVTCAGGVLEIVDRA